MNILIAEDDPISRRLLQRALENWGHTVVIAENGEQAWNLFQQNRARLVITDWVMPELDGPGLCQRINGAQEGSHDPAYVIMLTSRDSTEDLAAGLFAGANDFIAKPFHQEELRARLRNGERILALQEQLIAAGEQMRRLAMTDPLTLLLNRRAMLDFLSRDEDRMRRERRPLGVVMTDLDHFKSVNDRHGHGCGDAVLKAVGECLESCVRGGDYVGRWGGEEFLIALPGADPIQCAEVAERCRGLIAAQRIRLESGEVLSVTASFGSASTEGTDRQDLMSLIQCADKALYWAKESGRNRVKIYVPSADPSLRRRAE
jgi:two-component system chemotaxis response regulator CheY